MYNSNDIKINLWIATRTHKIGEKNSISNIYDAKRKVYYFLKGVSSRLWDLIVNSQNYEELLIYAQNNHLENELDAILYELKQKEIISSNKLFKKSDYNFLSKAISINSPNVKFFYRMWMQATYGIGVINSLFLEFNYTCNLKCRHCYNHKDMNEYSITFEQAKKIIDEAYELGISVVKITGGECTINKDFLKTAEYVKSKHLELLINTNGLAFYENEELMKKFLELYPTQIRISLYSMRPEVHDHITGIKGSWQKTKTVIERLNDAGATLCIAIPVLSYNKDCYKEVLDYAESKKISVGNACFFINNPKNNNLDAKLDFEDMEQYYIDTLARSGHIRKNFKKDDRPVCEAGWERLCITPKFDVTPCIAMYYVLGNLKSTTLKEITQTTLVDFRNKFLRKNLTECFNEEYCKHCIYCSDTACFTGTFMKKQPISCENAKACYNAVLYHEKKGK